MITYVISLLMIVCRLTAANPIAFESLLKTYALSLQVKDGSAQIGCFHYSPDDLVFSAEDSADARLTRRLCRNECSSRQFKFFVLYKGSYCYCGLKTFKVGSSQGCTSPCPGDSEETCGGPDALEVYRIVSGENQLTPTLDNAITTEENELLTDALSSQVKDGSAQIGCFHYSPDDLVFSAEDSADARLTRRLCRNECSSRQFKFFVLYKGSYCYCGLKTFKVGSSQGCTSPCPGDSEETCGGPDALEVYRIVSGENQQTPTLDNAITTEENELLTDTPSPQFQEAVQPSPSPESQEAVQPSPSPESHEAVQPSPSPQSQEAVQPSPSPKSQEAVQPSPSPQSQQSTSLYSGCFHVSRHNSVLSLNIRYDDSMTRTACRTSCSKYHFQYFGIHKGDSCYCGEELRSTTASTSCTIPCPGNASETCGGQDAIEVYKVSS